MSLATFDDLKSSIANHLGRTDLVAFIPDFISLAEARHKRDIRIKEMLTRASITVDARQVALPTGFLEAKTLRLLTSPITMPKSVGIHELNRVRQESTGKPSYYSISSEIEFDVSPDSAYSGEIIYYKAETALSDENTTNNLLAYAPDAYLYASLTASAPFLMDDARITIWNELYKQAAGGLSQTNKQGANVGPLVSRVSGATP